MVRHARKRYGLASDSAAPEISAAWGLLATSSYNHVLGDLDPSGVKYRACPPPLLLRFPSLSRLGLSLSGVVVCRATAAERIGCREHWFVLRRYFPAWASQFQKDRYTPSTMLCRVFTAWEKFVSVAGDADLDLAASAPFHYDLVK